MTDNSPAPLRHKSDADFMAELKPVLESVEAYRLEQLGVYLWRRKVAVIAGGLLTPVTGFIDYMLVTAWRSGDDDWMGLTFMLLGGLWYWATGPKRAYAKGYKKAVLPRIAATLGFRYCHDTKIPEQELEDSGIIPSHDRYKSEDHFEGAYKGASLRFAEIHLEQRRRGRKRTYYVTVFKGLAILVRLPKKKFLGHTILMKDRADMLEWLGEKTQGMKRANLVDPVFEKKYTVYTTDQVEARYLIDPAMIERITGLEKATQTGEISMAYHLQDRVLVLVPTKKNFFEPADILFSALDPDVLNYIRHDIDCTLGLVDYLEIYEPPREGPASSVPVGNM